MLYLTINDLRSDIDATHDNFYGMAVELAGKAGVEPAKKRTAGRQVNRQNVETYSVTEYYKRTITILFLDQLMGQIQLRFHEGNLDVFNAMYAMYAMPNHVVTDPD